MKITKIELKDFHQFKDVTLDLTYPAGHEKAGQPLDKVCFIGQSGTGKTTLLELIPKFLFDYNTNLINHIKKKMIKNSIRLSFVYGHSNEYEIEVSLKQDSNNTDSSWYWSNSRFYKRYKEEEMGYFDNVWSKKSSSKLIYFPTYINDDTITNTSFEEKKIIDFSKDNISVAWSLILETIQTYQEQELQIRQEISKTVEQSSNDLTTIKKALQKLEDWKAKEFNPIQDVATKCLNPLLKHFKLQIKTELDVKTKDDIGFIKIEDYNSNEIPYGLWSTGTKQVVLSALPLYLLKPKNTVILFDEPERSLYPDLQRLIVNFYSSLTTNCQFIYATHSPIIASSFEPWEIVELKFTEEGFVKREPYYKGENHIDNYEIDPRYMRWDDILQRIFDVEDDGSPERKKKLDELATLHVRYKKLDKQKKLDTEDAKAIIQKIETLSKELSHWN